MCQIAARLKFEKNVVVAINEPHGYIVVNYTTPLVLVHRIQMPVLERNGASYDLLVATTQNIHRENGMMDRREMPSKTYAFDGSKCNFGYPRAVEPTPPRAMEPVPQFEPGTASTSGQKRSTIDDDVSSLR